MPGNRENSGNTEIAFSIGLFYESWVIFIRVEPGGNMESFFLYSLQFYNNSRKTWTYLFM